MRRLSSRILTEARKDQMSMDQLWPLLASAFLMFGFNNTTTSALPEFIAALGGNVFVAGLQNTLFVLGAVILRIGLGPLADRIGAKRLLIVGALGFFFPCVLFPLCDSVESVFALRLVQCIGLAAYHPSVSHYITCHSTKSALPHRISLFRFASTASLMILPAFLFPLIGTCGFGPFFTLLALIAFVGLLLVLPLPGEDRERGASRKTKPDNPLETPCSNPPANKPFGPQDSNPRPSCHLFATIAMPAALACGYSVLLVFGPNFISTTMPQANSGLLLTTISLGGLAGSLLAPFAMRRLSVRWAVLLAMAALAGGMLLMGWSVSSFPMLIGASAICGFGYFGATTMLNAHLGRVASPQKSGAALSAQQSCLDGGMMLGSLLAGTLLQGGLSFSGVLGCTAILLAASAFAWLFFCEKQVL